MLFIFIMQIYNILDINQVYIIQNIASLLENTTEKRTCLCIIIKIAPIYVGKTSLHCPKKWETKNF